VNAAADALKQGAFLVVGSAPADSVQRDAVARAYTGGAHTVETLAVAGPPVEVLDRVVTNYQADMVVVGNVGLNTLTGPSSAQSRRPWPAAQVWTSSSSTQACRVSELSTGRWPVVISILR